MGDNDIRELFVEGAHELRVKVSHFHSSCIFCFLTQKASEITAATAADIVSDEALSKII